MKYEKKLQHPSKKRVEVCVAIIYPATQLVDLFMHGLPEMTLSKINELTGLR